MRMTPSEAFVETLVANEVTEVFGIMGSAFMDAMDIFAPAGIRLIPVVHEQGAAHMADGYTRASGEIAVCIAQNGPGITNFVTAVAAAYWNHTPMVVITPEGVKKFIHHFEQRVQSEIFHRRVKGKINYRRCFEMQARELAQAILEPDHMYRPFLVR